MLYDLKEIEERFKNLSEDELRKIVYVETRDYEGNVVELARKELKDRFELDIWESRNVTLKDVLLQVDVDRFQEVIFDESWKVSEYTNIFNRLHTIEPIKQSETFISIEKENPTEYKIIGEELATGEKVEIYYCSPQEWLGFNIDSEQLQQMGKERFVLYCIRAMSGISPDNDIEQELQNIVNSVTDISYSRCEQIPIKIENGITIDKIAERANQLKKEVKMVEKDYSIRPWVRYWARLIDLAIWGFIIWLIELLFIPHQSIKWFNSLASGMVANFTLFASWSFIEALFLSKWGFTPGKWILNTEVVNLVGNKLTYKDALWRIWNIFVYGEGFQIPFVNIVTNIVSYNRLSNQGKTKWDSDGGFRVYHRRIDNYKVFIAIIVLVGIPFLMIYVNRSYF